MKYCSHCGYQLEEGAVFCPACGKRVAEGAQKQNVNTPKYVQTYPTPQQPVVIATESSGLSIAALIFAILGGWLGLILSIIGVCTSKVKENKNRSKAALIISIIWIVIIVIIIAIAIGCAF